MQCMECANRGVKQEAVGLCHCCFAGLCLEHARVTPLRLKRLAPIYKVEELPIPARMVLCATCAKALEHPHLPLSA
ncbi:MAG: DUF2180 family protein [Bryobacterales bacterium]|nr:DUF2180 family protein [Bryobacterales bacterium]